MVRKVRDGDVRNVREGSVRKLADSCTGPQPDNTALAGRKSLLKKPVTAGRTHKENTEPQSPRLMEQHAAEPHLRQSRAGIHAHVARSSEDHYDVVACAINLSWKDDGVKSQAEVLNYEGQVGGQRMIGVAQVVGYGIGAHLQGKLAVK